MFKQRWYNARWFASWWFVRGGPIKSTLSIGSRDYMGNVQKNTLNITQNVSNRGVMSFTIEIDSISKLPKVGEEVIFASYRCQQGRFVREFAGTIEYLDFEDEECDGVFSVEIEVVDFNQIADRRVVANIYENMSPYEVIQDVVNNYVYEEGLDISNVKPPSKQIQKVVFSYIPFTKVLDDLSKVMGAFWYIDYFKKLHFFLRSAKANTKILIESICDCDFSVEDDELCVMLKKEGCSGGIRVGKIGVRRTRENLRNVQFVTAGYDTTTLNTEFFNGDNERTTFTTEFDVSNLLLDGDGTIDLSSIKVGGVNAATIASKGSQGYKDAEWVYEKGSKQFTYNDDLPPIPFGTDIEINYFGLIKKIGSYRDRESIGFRARVENNSGIYEEVYDDESIESLEYANDYAYGLVQRHKNILNKFRFSTDENVLEIGDLVDVNIPDLDVVSYIADNGGYLVVSKKIRDINGKSFRITYELVDGSFANGWQDFWKKIDFFGRQLRLNEQAALTVIVDTADDGGMIQTVTVTPGLATNVAPVDYTQIWMVGTAIVGVNDHRKIEYQRLGFI